MMATALVTSSPSLNIVTLVTGVDTQLFILIVIAEQTPDLQDDHSIHRHSDHRRLGKTCRTERGWAAVLTFQLLAVSGPRHTPLPTEAGFYYFHPKNNPPTSPTPLQPFSCGHTRGCLRV